MCKAILGSTITGYQPIRYGDENYINFYVVVQRVVICVFCQPCFYSFSIDYLFSYTELLNTVCTFIVTVYLFHYCNVDLIIVSNMKIRL